jgi:hypothetical protein
MMHTAETFAERESSLASCSHSTQSDFLTRTLGMPSWTQCRTFSPSPTITHGQNQQNDIYLKVARYIGSETHSHWGHRQVFSNSLICEAKNNHE